MHKFFKYIAVMIIAFLGYLPAAYAHIGVENHSSFEGGFFHPLTGADHILVMVAVGLWATQLGGSALVLVPVAFVASMGAGFLLALNGISLPFVEPAILASVIAVGLCAAMALRAPTILAMLIVGCFAIFHGHAHGAELGEDHAVSFAIGFALATAILHAAGIAIGLLASLFFGKAQKINATRIGGVITALAGLYLVFAG